MNEFEALGLGIVQGLTEFLPVSSSGHLVLVQHLLDVGGEGDLVFEVAVHVATLVATLVFYRKRIAGLVAGALRGRAEDWRYTGKLALGTLPAVAVALLAKEWIEASFAVPWVAGVGLLLTGAALWTTRSTLPRAQSPEPSWRAALLIGCAQALAILPGISRSGSTVAAALALGVAPLAAAEFSFLLGIVAIAGAALLTLTEVGALSQEALGALVIGSAAALVAGLAALSLFIRLLRRQNFHVFAIYTWLVGAAFLAWLGLR